MSFLSFLIKQFCNTIVCLPPKLSLDISFGMIDAIFGDKNFQYPKLLVLTVSAWLS